MKSEEKMTESEKDKYVEKRKAEINKWNDELSDLDARIEAAGADAKAKLEHKEHVAVLRQKRDEARAKLKEIEVAGDDRWEGLREGLENTWTNIKYGFEKVKAKF